MSTSRSRALLSCTPRIPVSPVPRVFSAGAQLHLLNTGAVSLVFAPELLLHFRFVQARRIEKFATTCAV